MDHELLVALMGDGYDKDMFGGNVYCGKKRPPPSGRAIGTPAQCFSKGVGVGLNLQRRKEEAPPTREDLEKMTLRKLGDMAREKRIPKYSTMKKAELIDAMLAIRGGMQSPQEDKLPDFVVARPAGIQRVIALPGAFGLPRPIAAPAAVAPAPVAPAAVGPAVAGQKRKAEFETEEKQRGKKGGNKHSPLARTMGHIAVGKIEVSKIDRAIKNARMLGMPERESELKRMRKDAKKDIESRERVGEHMLQEGYGKATKRKGRRACCCTPCGCSCCTGGNKDRRAKLMAPAEDARNTRIQNRQGIRETFNVLWDTTSLPEDLIWNVLSYQFPKREVEDVKIEMGRMPRD